MQIGRPVLNYKIVQLKAEKELYQDVLVTNLDEEYRDLTVHLLLAYEWMKNACPSVKYIYKIDDDTYVHLKYTEKYVKRLEFLRVTSNDTVSFIIIIIMMYLSLYLFFLSPSLNFSESLWKSTETMDPWNFIGKYRKMIIFTPIFANTGTDCGERVVQLCEAFLCK